MKLVREGDYTALRNGCAMTIGAALEMAGADFESFDVDDGYRLAGLFADIAREVWPDVTPRDLVALGLGAKYAMHVLVNGGRVDRAECAFADMVCSLRATVGHLEDKFGVSLG